MLAAITISIPDFWLGFFLGALLCFIVLVAVAFALKDTQ